MKRGAAWLVGQGWEPFDFQQATWQHVAAGRHGLLHAPTGTGKTYALWLAALNEFVDPSSHPSSDNPAQPLTVLWVTPLRALARDTTEALRLPVADLGLNWNVGQRTGDTPAAEKRRQAKRLPTALVTTPESLSLQLTYANPDERFRHLKLIVVDEWHELLGSKRGVQTELCLARLRALVPGLVTWGCSATMGNLQEARDVLVGPRVQDAVLVESALRKKVSFEIILPDDMERFPWSGHLGTRLLPRVVEAIERARTTLLFTNTRAQCELWYAALKEHVPAWEDQLAIHHGSIEREARLAVEERLREGTVRCVVCTSSLDLGVDYSPVEQVIHVGSPKGVGRILQRAGRSGHRPAESSRCLLVPAHAFELVEFAAARDRVEARDVEERPPLEKPLDLLAQHLVTVALGGGFEEEAFYREVRSTHAYQDLTREEWQWCVDFVTRGGTCLEAYPQFHKVERLATLCQVTSRQTAMLHRMSIGTIPSDQAVQLRFLKGGRIGSVEEAFIGKLRPGDVFVFGGRLLELRSVRDGTAYVRRAKSGKARVPVWMGGRMPLSSHLAAGVQRRLEAARAGEFEGPEMQKVRDVLLLQEEWSALPSDAFLLVESARSREGHHLFFFPLAGRLVHEGLSALVAHRLTRRRALSLRVFATDYGFELLGPDTLPHDEETLRALFSPQSLVEDLRACLNTVELAKRRFRDIARVAGLVFDGYPGRRKAVRQLTASSSLFFETFSRYDPGHPLLKQAEREVLQSQLELSRLQRTLEAIARKPFRVINTPRLTPFAFPVWAERTHAQASSESWQDKVQRMVRRLEAAAGDRDSTAYASFDLASTEP